MTTTTLTRSSSIGKMYCGFISTSDQTADVNRVLCGLVSIGTGQLAHRELSARRTNFLAIQFIPIPAMLANWPADIDIYPIRYFEPA